MHETGCSGLVHWDDPEGWYGEGGGRGLQDGEHVHPWWIHVNVWQNQYNIVKKKLIKKKKKVRVGSKSHFATYDFTSSHPFCWCLSDEHDGSLHFLNYFVFLTSPNISYLFLWCVYVVTWTSQVAQ